MLYRIVVSSVAESKTAANADDGKSESGSQSGKVAEHYNKLEEKGVEERKSSKIYFMRNFNNWVKTRLIGKSKTFHTEEQNF